VEIGFSLRNHPSQDLWEQYALGRLAEAQTAPLEEHLLLCSQCQTALTQADDYVQLMRHVMSEREAGEKQPKRKPQAPWTWRPVWVAAIAAACLLGVVYLRRAPPGPAATVLLNSLRGGQGDDSAANPAPSGKPLRLEVSAADLPVAESYRLEVVEQSGRRIWTGAASRDGDKVGAELRTGLAKGSYWVRIYRPSELLNEFELRVE
jgi:hypothetical protein